MILIFVKLPSNIAVWRPILKKLNMTSAVSKLDIDEDLHTSHARVHPTNGGTFELKLERDLELLYEGMVNNPQDIAIINLDLDLTAPPGLLQRLREKLPKCIVHKGNWKDWESLASATFQGCTVSTYTTGDYDQEAYKEFCDVLSILGVSDNKNLSHALHDFDGKLASLQLLIKSHPDGDVRSGLGDDPDTVVKHLLEDLTKAFAKLTSQASTTLVEGQEGKLVDDSGELLNLIRRLLLQKWTTADEWKPLESKIDAWNKWVEQIRSM